MNPKIEKVSEEIEKVKRKVSEYTNRLRDLERLKTELENADIVALVRSVGMENDGELTAFLQAYKAHLSGAAVAPTSMEDNYTLA